MISAKRTGLTAAEKRFRALPKEIKNDLRRYQRSEAGPIWKQEVNSRLGANRISQRTFRTGNTVKAGSTMILRAAGSGRKLSSGAAANSSFLLYSAEYGSKNPNARTKYGRRSPKGKSHTVTRRVSRQSPQYRQGGYVINPAAKASIKRITSLSVQTITKRIHQTIDGS
ncbi:hypothetical protein [Arthrobacter ulcerisalmonis]|uniref:hypothetical protein n=1 Tax=Arthrobacter ulcerisalmonis TaxID=2483813 RepID=UPI000F526F34|nr:hypothetical protein [Arthrobacter ulcerisalmonis]